TYLLEYARATRETLKDVFLVHGESKPAQALTEKLAAQGIDKVHYPDLHEEVTI
ncbi:MAG: hypothetical protein JRJ29_17810, partial [Deltaproteobacteria bacterium]|nr:hypothetical protein [Deltaproteobacteria bacterium]